jgi:ribosomal subunit interface protein
MDIRVTGKHIDIGQALPEHVRKELPASIGKHFGESAKANVVFVKERNNFRADCTIHLSSGSTFQVRGAAADAYRAFGEALEHLEKRVRRYMRRLKNHHGRGHA